MNHVISWSGGKDSTATVILMHEHENEILNPGDKVTILFAEIMFSNERNISGINPDVIDFIYKTKVKFEAWGYDIQILRSEKDFLDVFYHRLKRSPDPARVGLVHGFPAGVKGKCAIKRDCKLKPINDWFKNNTEEMIQYVGIALDEPDRLVSLHKKPGFVSLLEKYGITEANARKMCEDYDMLSPQYAMDGGKQGRDGCWFCPNAKLCEHKAICERYPKAWKEYVNLEKIPELAYPKWNCYSKQTLSERDFLIQYFD